MQPARSIAYRTYKHPDELVAFVDAYLQELERFCRGRRLARGWLCARPPREYQVENGHPANFKTLDRNGAVGNACIIRGPEDRALVRRFAEIVAQEGYIVVGSFEADWDGWSSHIHEFGPSYEPGDALPGPGPGAPPDLAEPRAPARASQVDSS